MYTRVSTAMQIDNYSIEAQRTRIMGQAALEKISIVGEYSDEGHSGKNISGRPAFQEMLADIEARKDKIDYVLVFKLSRFGRNTADAINSLQLLQDYGIELYCVEDNIKSSNAYSKLMFAVMASMAELERENIIAQTMSGRKQKAKLGGWNGGFAPYGYDLVEGELVIREDLFYRLSTIPIKVPPLRERGADVQLLFRKFAADCAEKYRMPAIQLTEDAKQMLMTYHWPGNVRQLKNITEQISIMATQRVITADMLQEYLPDRRTSMLPMLAGGQRQENSFENEREILYKVLFDMRRDITDLKAQVNSMSQNQQPVQQPVSIITPDEGTTVQNVASRKSAPVDDDIQDTEVYVEETLSLDEVEKDMIKRALAKHGGKRRGAAADLNISERTLYRKIKEYNLE